MIFVFLTANFYSILAARLAKVDVYSAAFRAQVSPLNTPPNQQLVDVVRDASTSSFHLAMLIGAGLLLLGAIVNGIGIRSRAAQAPAQAEPALASDAEGG